MYFGTVFSDRGDQKSVPHLELNTALSTPYKKGLLIRCHFRGFQVPIARDGVRGTTDVASSRLFPGRAVGGGWTLGHESHCAVPFIPRPCWSL